MERPLTGQPTWVGRVLELEVGAVAHGGHCVARYEGRVVFVRHTLPGELVRARVTEGAEGSRFLRADAVEIVRSSPDRVPSRCPVSGPGGCGGCDWQHVSMAGQRALKAAVVEEQLRRLGHLDTSALAIEVEPVDGDEDGLAWRTRVQYAVDPQGRLGLRRHRSHDVVELQECPIAHPQVRQVPVTSHRWPGATGVEVIAGSDPSDRLVVVDPGPSGPGRVPIEGVNVTWLPTPAVPASRSRGRAAAGRAKRQEVAAPARGRGWVRQDVRVGQWSRSFRVSGSGFWQVHPGAAAALVGAVREALDPRSGEVALDLYCGVGLFAAALADAVAPDGVGPGRVLAVESDPGAVKDARRNLHDLPAVQIVASRVDAALTGGPAADPLVERADLVVLDPPRTGAGRKVVHAIAALAPRAIAYVACDPAALGRDIAWFGELGYRVQRVRAFDAFPMTSHVECVAHLVKSGSEH